MMTAIVRRLVTWLPFVCLITLHSLAVAAGYRLQVLMPVLAGIGIGVVATLLVAGALRVSHPFTWAVGGVTLLGIGSVFIAPESLGHLFVHHTIAALYVGLLLAAVVPTSLGWPPFTVQFSKGSYPPAIVASEQFLRVNQKMSWIWAVLFGVALVLSVVPYASDSGVQVIVSSLVPIALLLSVGVPLNRLGPAWLMQRTPAPSIHFDSLTALFEAMPFGLNRAEAEGVDALVQFHLTGDEPTEGFLRIVDQTAIFTRGVHPSPKTIIRADSALWLQISNGDVSGDWAYLNNKYEVSGDLSVLMNLTALFSPPAEEKAEVAPAPKPVAFRYADLGMPLRRVVVFDGGPRSGQWSKTTMMARQFCAGAEAAGAQVEYIELRRKKIRDCTGCYTCWTKTPGTCIFDRVDDDMEELRRLYREADLVVLATPLYIFSATGLMKTFLDRTLPNLKPYMLLNEHQQTMHPHRYNDDPEQGLVVFSAAGFPDIEGNFDGLRGMVRCMNSHYEKQSLMAEFYLPAAEFLSHAPYAPRLKRVQEACFEAGRQAVSGGRVSLELMQSVADPGITPLTFQSQADHFWETLDGKKSFYKGAPKLPKSGTRR